MKVHLKHGNNEGLTSTEVTQLQAKFGLNILKEEKRHSWMISFALQFHNPMVYVLLAATIISFFMGETLNSLAILTIVVLNAFIGFIQELKAESSIDSLRKLTVPKARVKRNHKIELIESSQIVPGDILILEAGDYIVADAKIVKASQLTCDESILTGESIPVSKEAGEDLTEDRPLAERSNWLFAGTAINSGSATGKVLSIGMQTELGKIAGLLDKTKTSETPLQTKMNKVSYRLLILGLAVMVVVFIIGLVKGHSFFSIFMYSISLAVAAIPEGLPTVVTLALALAVRRMSKRNAIVRKMAAVETLGSADIICTDKTGTLTTGKMLAREVFTFEQGIVEKGEAINSEEFLRACILCNNASLDNEGSGDTTEIALLVLAKDQHLDIDEILTSSARTIENSFDSDRKRMSVVVETRGEEILYCKGAPESILPLCHLDQTALNKIESIIEQLSFRGRRLLALSFKKINNHESPEENNLSFLGLVSLADPPKQESFSAIESCKAAGIKVIMITGDHPRTAEAIAKELGIIENDKKENVMTGKELDQISQEDFLLASEKVLVYARVSPEHKLKIIEALQKNGHIVGMTGDGVNDAPALKQASIGISMGLGGTEVARQASDMVLTDDNFSTIVSAIEEGRAVHGNIKRTIQYLLSTNMAELAIVFGTILFGMPNPFIPLSLLWINIVTDGLPSIALSMEPVRYNLLKTSRRPSSKNFFDTRFVTEMILVAVMITAVEMVVYNYTLKMGDELYAKTCAFNLLVYLTLFRSFSCRSSTETYFKLKFNPIHLVSVVVPIGLQITLESNEYFLSMLKITSITFEEHAILILVSLIPVTVVEIYKILSSGHNRKMAFHG